MAATKDERPGAMAQAGGATAEADGSPRRVTVDPITRLERHGKIDIFLDEAGKVDRAYFQVPELRGFEQFAKGRPAEDMPQITSRICGVCPTAHHMAGTKALDSLYRIEPPPAAERNILEVIARVGVEVGKKVIAMRRRLRELISLASGKVIHPVFGLPGGVAKRLTAEDQARFKEVATEAVDFARFTLDVFDGAVLKNSDYVDLILSDAFTHRTYYMGLVDERDRVSFYDGEVRVVAPDGEEYARFKASKYLDYVAEHVEPWSYIKFCYLKPVGWKGFRDGPESGVYCVVPLARLNAASDMATPLAQEAYERFFATLKGKPVHHTLANHWARVVELLYAAERMKELAEDPEIIDPRVRNIPTATPREGVGVVEALRGTLFHHYQTDERGVITRANLIVATQNNAARIAMGVDKAAKGLITGGGKIPEGILNMVEITFRAYDHCHGCATHSLPGSMPLFVRVLDPRGATLATLRRDLDGAVRRE